MATANPSSPFSYASDNPLAPEFLALERQKKMADLLLQKGQKQPEGETNERDSRQVQVRRPLCT